MVSGALGGQFRGALLPLPRQALCSLKATGSEPGALHPPAPHPHPWCPPAFLGPTLSSLSPTPRTLAPGNTHQLNALGPRGAFRFRGSYDSLGRTAPLPQALGPVQPPRLQPRGAEGRRQVPSSLLLPGPMEGVDCTLLLCGAVVSAEAVSGWGWVVGEPGPWGWRLMLAGPQLLRRPLSRLVGGETQT